MVMDDEDNGYEMKAMMRMMMVPLTLAEDKEPRTRQRESSDWFQSSRTELSFGSLFLWFYHIKIYVKVGQNLSVCCEHQLQETG